MSIAIDSLLAFTVALELLCTLGVLAADTPFDRLHYLAPLLLGLFALAMALTLAKGFSPLALKAWAVCVLAVISSPIVAHAAARAARVRQFAGWHVLESEKAEAQL